MSITALEQPTRQEALEIVCCIEEALCRLGPLQPHQERTDLGRLLLDARTKALAWFETGGYADAATAC